MPLPPTPDFQLHHNAHGQLVLTLADGTVHAGVLPVRAFPLAAPEEGLSLVGTNGQELVWIERFAKLPAPLRDLIAQELAAREFVPTIARIHSVSGFSTPSTWHIDTDRGPTQLVLKAEEDIRRLPGRTALLIADSHGVQYAVRDTRALDKESRRLLERFL